MTNQTKAALLRNRIAILEARGKDNANIVKALKREIRNLEG